MKKIVLFGVDLPGGGVETVINNFSLHLSDSFQLRAISLSRGDLNSNWARRKVCHKVYPIIDDSKNLYLQLLVKKAEVENIVVSEIREYEPDLTVVLSSQLLGFVRKVGKSRLIFWPHHLLNRNQLYLSVIRHLTKDLEVWCVNRQILEQFHSNRKRILTYNPVDIAKSEMALNEPPNKVKLVSVGFLNERKNFGQLIHLLSEIDIEWSLEIYGTGKLLAPLRDLVSELELVERVQFKGYEAIFNRETLGYSAYITTSLSEGFSMSLCEAALRGIPLILPDYLEVSQEFESNGLATLFDVSDSVSLMAAINSSLQSDPRKIRECIVSDFGKEAFLSRIDL